MFPLKYSYIKFPFYNRGYTLRGEINFCRRAALFGAVFYICVRVTLLVWHILTHQLAIYATIAKYRKIGLVSAKIQLSSINSRHYTELKTELDVDPHNIRKDYYEITCYQRYADD